MNYRATLWGLFGLLLLASPAIAQQVLLTGSQKQALTLVKPEEMKADIRFLADDKLLGRAPGTPGFQMAADYVIDHLKKLDVQPAGENGTWMQQVRFRKAFLTASFLSLSDKQGKLNALDKSIFQIYPNPVQTEVSAESGLAFVGYGVSAPSVGYDDYKGMNVKGKTVVVVRGAPENFPSSVSAHTMNMTTILKTAAAHGAVGVILASTDSSSRMLPNVSRGIYSIMDDKGKVSVSRSYADKIKFYASVKYDLLKGWAQATGQTPSQILASLKKGQPVSFNIDQKLAVNYQSRYEDMLSFNVVGKITGSDSKLKKEYVVHSAHLDHLGVGRPVEGDSIYNGAHDNASGVASVLAIAKMYNSLEVKPKRSILFVLMTGEELGDMGSGYFANHPTVKVKQIVADVNTDMPTIIAPLLSVTALGAEHSTLAKKVEEAATYMGLSVEPDPEPKQARFTRSDQYSFVVAGIPALHVKYGSKTPDGKNNLNDQVAIWRAKYYHKPQDDINGIFDFNAGVKYAQLNFLIGLLVAQDPQRPEWNTGDIFEHQ